MTDFTADNAYFMGEGPCPPSHLTEQERKDRLAATVASFSGSNKRGTNWVMPTVRHNPRKEQQRAGRSLLPSRDKRVNRREAASVSKVAYPTTVALRDAVSGLDPIAKREALYLIATENGITPEKWDHLNNGQVAMNLGNTLRGRYYKNQTILIQGKEID